MSDSYGIIRLKKTKGAAVHAAQYHNDRLPGNHSNPDIDPSKTKLNVQMLAHGSYEDEIENRLKGVKRKVRADAVKLVDGILTASPEWFEAHSRDEAMAFFQDGLEFVQDFFGKSNVFYYTIHLDETTPHAHFGATPIKDGSLSWKKFFPGRDALVKFQDRFFEQVSSKYGMERGTKREAGEPVKHHKTVAEFKIEKARELDREIAEKTDRLESLQGQEIELGDAVEDLKREVEAVEAGDVGFKDALGAEKEACRIEGENRDLEAESRRLDDGNRNLERRVGELEQRVAEEGDRAARRARETRECRGKRAVLEAEAGRLEKASGLIAGALERGHDAVISILTRLIRTNDLRDQDPGPGDWNRQQLPKYEAQAASIRPEPKGKGKVHASLAEVEAKLKKMRIGIKLGMVPKPGAYNRLIGRRDKLDAQTPEAMQMERDYRADRYINGYAASIQRARGPEKAKLIAELGKIANDRTLSGRVRSNAARRISWIEDGAPSGAPAGAGTPAPTQHRGPQATYGGEARTIERGAR